MSLIKAARAVRTAEAFTRICLSKGRNRCPQAFTAYRRVQSLAQISEMASDGRDASDMEADRRAVERFRQLVPTLGGNYKGAHGKVVVIGGCLEFTGAPFFAAMSALRVGADMAYVICTPSASTAIKSYSPELMVLPYLPEQPQGLEDGPIDQAAVERAVTRIAPWLARATTVVVGTGLGADPAVCAATRALMGEIRRLGLPLVVDGSALTHVVAKHPDTVSGYRPCVLTPNVAELGRIAGAVGLPLPGRMSDAWLAHAPEVALAFKGPLILAKGEVDLLCADTAGKQGPLLRCSGLGSLRRCGGQGDVLAGTAAAFLSWAVKHQGRSEAKAPGGGAKPGSLKSPSVPPQRDAGDGGGEGGLDTDTVALCAYLACKVMRGAARAAYDVGERSMVAGDIIPLLYPTFKQIVGFS